MRFTLLVIPYLRERGEKVGAVGGEPARFQRLMQQLKTQMVFAESVGYDGFCMTEHHLQVEGVESTTNPLFWDYFVAQHTKKMRVGQLGMNLTVINPIQLAENIAMLDHLTGGRVFAGFSRGNTARWANTFGQHIGIGSTESDRSAADQRNREIFYENWNIVKQLWTQPTVDIDGKYWQVPPEMHWHFAPTDDWAPETLGPDHALKRVGIVPRPLQTPHPPVYAPFSYSMETSKFWAREGGKMVSFVAPEKESFIRTALDVYMAEAEQAGRQTTTQDSLAIGGHLVCGSTPAESRIIEDGFRELFRYAYDAPPYHVPMGRLWKGSRQQMLDDVATLAEKFGVEEFFCWHHVGWFTQEQEMSALNEFAEAVIKPLNGEVKL
ncbi:MAG TPA: LLM class flavin-dependent oxidoreductase [Bordetella sp.]